MGDFAVAVRRHLQQVRKRESSGTVDRLVSAGYSLRIARAMIGEFNINDAIAAAETGRTSGPATLSLRFEWYHLRQWENVRISSISGVGSFETGYGPSGSTASTGRGPGPGYRPPGQTATDEDIETIIHIGELGLEFTLGVLATFFGLDLIPGEEVTPVSGFGPSGNPDGSVYA